LSSEVKVTVVCSTQDRASQNIKNNLLALRKWEQKSSELYTVFEFKNYRIVEIKEGPLFGRLARGDSVMLDGKTINPEMVYEINIRAIKLNYEKAIEE